MPYLNPPTINGNRSLRAGSMISRQPVERPEGFGPRPSRSCFLYNQDGSQAIACPYLDDHSARWLCAPFTLVFERSAGRYAMRCFVAD